MQILFKNCPALVLELDSTPLAQRWKQLCKATYLQDPFPIFRDPQKYTVEFLKKLAQTASLELGWNWDTNDLSLQSTTRMHKDIEQFLSAGFQNIPEQYDQLLHDIHFCLHSVESGSKRSSWLQIEWFNDAGFPIVADEYPAKIKLEFGDIRLQNPYVGHHPLFLYEQLDHANILQTCRFHDLCRPGLCIVVDQNQYKNNFDWERYLTWFVNNGKEFVEKVGIDALIKYTGHPVIGHIVNVHDLNFCLEQDYLEFDKIIWD
jgi:hypothetical protein